MAGLPDCQAVSADFARDAARSAPMQSVPKAARSMRLRSSSTMTHRAFSIADGRAAQACSTARASSPAPARCHAASACECALSPLAACCVYTLATRACSRHRLSGGNTISRCVFTASSLKVYSECPGSRRTRRALSSPLSAISASCSLTPSAPATTGRSIPGPRETR